MGPWIQSGCAEMQETLFIAKSKRDWYGHTHTQKQRNIGMIVR